jgi:hypothetical protein
MLAGLHTLVAGLDRVKAVSDGYPTTYVALIAAYSCALAVLLAIWAAAPRLEAPAASVLALLNRTGLSVVVGVGLLSAALLVGQIEAWLLPGSRMLIATASIGALAAIVLGVSQSGYLRYAGAAFLRYPRRVADVCRGWRLSPGGWLLVVVVAVRAAISGYYAVVTPLMCDEASTYWLFGRSVTEALTHYESPNNHLLNSALVFLSTTAFGHTALGIRLPAVIVSVAMVPAAFLLCRTLFDRRVALLGSVLAATALWLLFYSFQARGYSYVVLFSAAAIATLWLTLDDPDSRLLWWLFVASMSLAFASLPTTLYLWMSVLLFGGGLRRRRADDVGRRWFRAFALSMAMILAMAALTYLNALVFLWRTGHLSAEFFVMLQPTSLRELGSTFLRNAIAGGFDEAEAALGKPLIALVTIAAGSIGIFSLFRERRLRLLWLYVCLFLGPLPLLLIEHPLPFARNFLYLLPFISVLAGYGVARCIDLVAGLFPGRRPMTIDATVAMLLFTATLIPNARVLSNYLAWYHRDVWPAGSIARYLEQTAQSTDGIVAGTCLDYMLASSMNPAFHVTSVLQLWSNPPTAPTLYVVPGLLDVNGDTAARDLLKQACQDHTPPEIVSRIGRQYIYRCERL